MSNEFCPDIQHISRDIRVHLGEYGDYRIHVLEVFALEGTGNA
jgi:hypothetical protein